MAELLYIKYNSHRKPEYQLSTKIISDGKKKRVIKMPITGAAEGQISVIKNNYKLLKNYYNRIKPVSYTKKGNGLSFEYVEGESLITGVDFNGSISDICERLSLIIDDVLDIREDFFCEFELSDTFKRVFPECEPSGMALSLCNIDSIFSNFVRTRDGLVCIDYEWIFSFPIPVDYIRFRILLYLYNEKKAYFQDRISIEDFLELFNISGHNRDIFFHMEDCFQDYVHGKNRKYIYIENYKKNIISLPDFIKKSDETKRIVQERELTIQNLNDMVSAKDNHIINLEHDLTVIKEEKDEQAKNYDSLLSYEIKRRDNDIIYRDGLLRVKDEQIAHLSKMTRNPMYWGYCLVRKVIRKIARLIETDKQREKREEIERVGIYKFKYKDIKAFNDKDYQSWIERIEENYPKPKRLRYNPKISVLVPVYNVLDKHLIPCIESVINQTYSNWELCLADDNSTWDNVRKTLKKYEGNPRIKIIYREENGHISEATNSALEMATGEYVGLLDCDDVLSPNALYEMAQALNDGRELDFIYSDEDKIDDDGNNRHMPHFKPDWSPDTLMSNMYTCHFTVYRKSLVNKVGGLRTECNGSQDYDLALRIMNETSPERIAHIDKILYHWREREESTSGNATVKPYVFEAAKKAKLDSLKQRGIEGKVEFVDEMYQYNVIYDVQGYPKVSIIIPSKDNYEVLRRCIESIYNNTTYSNYEVLLVDNGSNDENRGKYTALSKKYGFDYYYEKQDFNFSKMCNIGLSHSVGEFILLLNDDIEIPPESKEWLSVMLGHAQLSYVGAVGAKLLYPNSNKIQHVGVINIENGPTHALSGMPDDIVYYFGRNRLNYNVLCVTAACLLISREKYKQVKGLDESFAVAYNDVDFCMKLVEEGYFNVIRNDVKLIHHESISRGNDLADINKKRRLMDEEARLYDMHKSFSHYDPFYNRNLNQFGADFSNNIDDYKLIVSRVEEYNGEKRILDDNIKYSIDAINVERYIYIEGWIYINGYKANNDLRPFIVLSSKDYDYKVETRKVYREDLEIEHTQIKDVEFSGFMCRVSRKLIKNGKYKIFIKVDNYFVDTQKVITI